jgi:hypothetical protein
MQTQSLIALLWMTTTIVTGYRPPLLVSEELGCSPTLSVLFTKQSDGYFFDPLKLANDVNFSRFREAELKHGRIAMLATIATSIPPLIHDYVDWIPKDYPSGILKALKQLPTTELVKVVVTCGILETVVFVQRNPTDMPGDYGVGYFGLRDKGLHEAPLISELEHGRLAMLAFVGQVALEYFQGSIFVPSMVK